jgi:hypothetical protein
MLTGAVMMVAGGPAAPTNGRLEQFIYKPPSMVTYYVTKSGSDSNTCVQAQNQATAKLTISAGAACLSAGQQVLVRTGTYVETLTQADFTNTGTSWSSKVRVAAYPGDVVTLRPTSGGHGIADTTISYVEIENLILDGINAGGGEGAAVWYCADTSDHIRMIGVELMNGDGNGMLCGGSDHEFINMIVHTNGLHAYLGSNGMYMFGDNTTITGGLFYDNECYGVRFYDSAAGTFATGNVVQQARVYENGFDNGLSGASQCSSGGGGIVLGDQNNIARNNLVYGNYWGMQVPLEKSGHAPSFFNNTVTANDYGVDMSNEGSAVTFSNNIVYNNPGVDLYQMTGVVQQTNYTSNPNFVNAGAFNFQLNVGSGAIDTGTTLGSVTNDFAGTSRPQGSAYDIGAYER